MRELPERAVAPLERMLEALVRVHDFEGFEALLALLPRTPLPERERRELLAGALPAPRLRRARRGRVDGGLRRAARRARAGRTRRVSLANGMALEASEFASAALERNPDSERAAQLLAHARNHTSSTP